MPKILVFQHVAFEILGTLNPLLKDAGFRIRYVNFGRYPAARPSLEGYHGLVILGGPMSVGQVDEHPHLTTELSSIEEAIGKGIPILGICLGAQLIARALGAEVKENPEKEIGWYDLAVTEEGEKDPLFRHMQPSEKVFQWHGDAFEIPAGAVHLATSPSCSNQAFRYGSNVYGFQFHLEVDEPLIERWLRVPVHRRELQGLKGRIAPEQIRRETALYVGNLKQLSDRTFQEFIGLFGRRKRYRMLPSR